MYHTCPDAGLLSDHEQFISLTAAPDSSEMNDLLA
jgi:hypothetical protein